MPKEPYEVHVRYVAGKPNPPTIRYLHTDDEGNVTEGRAQPLAGTTDPAFTAFAAQFSVAVIAERDTLATDKASLTTTLATRTSELAAMAIDRDGERAAKETALTRITALEADLATARTEKADAIAAKSEAESALTTMAGERDAALAEVDRLTALLNPVDQQGFPILSAVQLRLGLIGAGISLATVDAAIAGIPDTVQRVRAQTYWEYATQFHRDNPLIVSVSALLGLTTEQVDTLWRAAGAI